MHLRAFQTKGESVGVMELVQYQIDTGDARLEKQSARRLLVHTREEFGKQVTQLTKDGLIKSSTRP